jgi:hypothetical protein
VVQEVERHNEELTLRLDCLSHVVDGVFCAALGLRKIATPSSASYVYLA